jgi:hypothetical protein
MLDRVKNLDHAQILTETDTKFNRFLNYRATNRDSHFYFMSSHVCPPRKVNLRRRSIYGGRHLRATALKNPVFFTGGRLKASVFINLFLKADIL